MKDDKVLLGRRHEDAGKADSQLHGEGTWTMPGGKLDFKEKLRDAAFREVFEETGIKVDREKLSVASVTDDIVEDAHFVTIGFLCQDFEGDPEVKEPDEIVEWKWFNLNELPEPMFFPSKKIVENYKRSQAEG